MTTTKLHFPKNQTSQIYLLGVAENPANGIYKTLIKSARDRGAEYSKIWDLFAFQESFTVHLARFTEGVLRTPASISPTLRELIAASTSYQNECAFCTQAHAAAASQLYGDEELVWSAITDLETAALSAKDKVLLHFTNKVTKHLSAVSRTDIEILQAAGWDDEAIYYAITTCALFNFYNRWITATGVPEMSLEAHQLQGQNLAKHGYIRGDTN